MNINAREEKKRNRRRSKKRPPTGSIGSNPDLNAGRDSDAESIGASSAIPE